MRHTFRDRQDAGVQLAATLLRYANDPTVLVLGLPRGQIAVTPVRTVPRPLSIRTDKVAPAGGGIAYRAL